MLGIRFELVRALDAVGDAAPVCDVAGRVLVEQGVEEDVPDLPDTGGAVDERDLAEARGALVCGDLRADVVLSRATP